MPKISVIVPVYNVEKYLKKCIDSILSQTYRDFELILVDDGSLDNSGAICDEYARIDKRVRVIHQKNAGVSSAKNTGITASKGEYLFFVDSDDYIAMDCLDILLSQMERYCCDLITIGYTEVNESYEILRFYYPEPGVFSIINTDEKLDFILNYALKFKMSWGMFKLFKSEIIKSNHITVCESCENFAEDLGFLLTYIVHCSRIGSIKYTGYYYLRRHDSMMGESKTRIRLNSMNEVAYSFWKHLKSMDYSFRTIIRRFPVLHFLIVNNQISLRFISDNLEGIQDEINHIYRKNWYNCMVIRSIRFRKYILKYLEKSKAKWCLNVYYFTAYRSRKLYLLRELISYRLRKVGKKSVKD